MAAPNEGTNQLPSDGALVTPRYYWGLFNGADGFFYAPRADNSTAKNLRVAWYDASGNALGTNANPVQVGDGGASLTVDGAVTANIGTSGALALDATLTGGTQKAIARGAAKGATPAGDVTSTAVDANTQALDVSVKGTAAVSVSNFPATQPVSAAALPLPAGAATEATLGGVLTTAAFQARVNTLGQKTMANSAPVVLASDQGAIAVSGTLTANIGTSGALALDATLTGGTQKAILRGGAKGSTAAADVTSVAVDANTQAAHVQLAGQGAAGTPLRTDPTGATAQPVTDNGGSLTVDGAVNADVRVAGAAVANANPLPVSDAGGSLTVDGSVSVSNFPATQPVSGAVTANIGTSGALALDATLTGGAAKAVARGGAKGSTAAADVTSVAVDANTQALHVQLAGQGAAGTALRTDPTGATAQPVTDNAGSLTVDAPVATPVFVRLSDGAAAVAPATAAQLPAALVGGRLDVNVGAGTVTVAQAAAANLNATVTGAVTANIGTSGALALDATLTGGTARAKITDGVSNAAVKAASTAAVAADAALVVAVSPNNSVAVTQAAAANLNATAAQGAPAAIANSWPAKVTDGTTAAAVKAASTAVAAADAALVVAVSPNAGVSIGQSVGKTNVLKTGTLVSTLTTADQVVLTYTVTALKTFFLEYVSLNGSLTAVAATAAVLGTMSLETPSGAKVYTVRATNPTTSEAFHHVVPIGEPIPIAAGVVVRVVVTPAATTSTTWFANFGGYER